MKAIIRTFVFCYISLFITQKYVGAIEYSENILKSQVLLVLGLALLTFFLTPVLGIFGFKSKGLGLLLINLILTGIVMYFLAPIIPGISFRPVTLPSLNISGYMLPSKSLTATMALVFSALVFSIVLSFLSWLCPKKK